MKRKIAILLLALVMVLAMGTVAFAATIDNTGIVESSDKTVTIQKEITAFNPAGSTVNAPSITYTYTIAPGTAGKTITDANGVSVDTVAGPTGATITSSITWDADTADDQMTTASDGKENYKTITADFTNVTFPAAGVYRYVITETATYTNTGVVDGGDHTRYIDVYVKNSDEGGYEIYAYTCFKNNNNIDGRTDATDDTPAEAVKTEGFVDDTDDHTTDKYYTYNLTVTKTVENDAGMKSHEFPFGIAFSGSETGVLPIISGTAGTKPTWDAKGAMSTFDTTVDGGTLKIAHGQSVVITGIPVGTSVTINEKNDVTGTTYTSVSTGADTNAVEKSIATGDTSNDAIIAAQTAGSEADKSVTFTNTRTIISPTGLALRYGPFVLLLAGAACFFLIGRRRRETEEESDRI